MGLLRIGTDIIVSNQTVSGDSLSIRAGARRILLENLAANTITAILTDTDENSIEISLPASSSVPGANFDLELDGDHLGALTLTVSGSEGEQIRATVIY